jgi:Kef-type K+ transport system membrane component KefB
MADSLVEPDTQPVPGRRTLITILLACAACLAVLGLARIGRWVAERLRQPPVIAEIAVGLVLGPLVVAIAGRSALDGELPSQVLSMLRVVGQIGVVWYLVGAAYRIRPRAAGVGHRAMGWVLAGSLIPSLVAGGGLAGWLVWTGDQRLRGDAPGPAFVLLLSVAMAITAVPVLARILASRRIDKTPDGALAMTVAVTIDAVGWLLLAAALALAARGPDQMVAAATTIVCGLAGLLVTRMALRGRYPSRFAAAHPVIAAGLIAVAALVVAAITEHYGVTIILGAVLVGLAIPASEAWARPVRYVARVGIVLVPIFFVAAGIRLLSGSFDESLWALVPVVLVLAMTSKIVGTWAGARLGGLPSHVGWRLGVLMDTRGLTEIVVLQAGLDAGILTPGLFFVMLVMALVTTAATGPLLDTLERRRAAHTSGETGDRRLPEPEPAP